MYDGEVNELKNIFSQFVPTLKAMSEDHTDGLEMFKDIHDGKIIK